MLVVLGPPGSGCSTLLKTIAGEMNGIHADRESYMNYQGKSSRPMPPFVSIDVDQQLLSLMKADHRDFNRPDPRGDAHNISGRIHIHG